MKRFAAMLLVCAPMAAQAGFDWGQDCDDGSGSFTQFVPYGATDTVGTIPDDKRDVFIHLDADDDVDVQLIDVATGTQLIAWPNGLINGPSQECQWWQGVQVCYSGYNGDQTASGLGREWIRINGKTARQMEMRVYGYASGNAEVTYTYRALPTCNEIGDGAFNQYIPYYATTNVGDVPAGKTNVEIDLVADAGRDVDVQLWDGNTPVVMWPDGMLNGAGEASVAYAGATITWSGYNGIDGNWGHERITIDGSLSRTLTLKAFGYQSGTANVDYTWGVGVGATCGGIAWLQCDEGLECKEWQVDVSDPAGQCHTPNWCDTLDTAATDCTNIPHIMAVGYWDCVEHECVYELGRYDTCADPERQYRSHDPSQCQVMRYTCEAGLAGFSDTCGCGCECPALISCGPDDDCDIAALSQMCPQSVFEM